MTENTKKTTAVDLMIAAFLNVETGETVWLTASRMHSAWANGTKEYHGIAGLGTARKAMAILVERREFQDGGRRLIHTRLSAEKRDELLAERARYVAIRTEREEIATEIAAAIGMLDVGGYGDDVHATGRGVRLSHEAAKLVAQLLARK